MILPEFVENISSDNQPLAFVIRSGTLPPTTTFLTPPEFKQQIGFIVYPAASEVPRHEHRPMERQLLGTSEVIIVWKGRCEVDLYDHTRVLVATRELRQGDIILLVNGGHGFRLLEDTVLLEIKQGPYLGLDEKEYF